MGDPYINFFFVINLNLTLNLEIIFWKKIQLFLIEKTLLFTKNVQDMLSYVKFIIYLNQKLRCYLKIVNKKHDKTATLVSNILRTKNSKDYLEHFFERAKSIL